jgi:hypothetical protein
MNDINAALPMIQAVVGRYLDGDDSLEDAAISLAGVLRRVPAYDARTVPPALPTGGASLRKLTPQQWADPLFEKGGALYGFSIAPAPFTPERLEQAHALMTEALKLLYSEGAA